MGQNMLNFIKRKEQILYADVNTTLAMNEINVGVAFSKLQYTFAKKILAVPARIPPFWFEQKGDI